MRHKLSVLILVCLAGFAATCEGSTVSDLKKQLANITNKFEAAKKENLNLKRELTFLRKTQHFDSRKFVEAMDIFGRALFSSIERHDAELKLTDRGLDIIVNNECLFVSGSDALSNEGKSFLDRVLKIIAEMFQEDYVYVEGHTDNQSLAVFEWKSDWDFSFARALSVVQYFKEKGVDPLHLSAAGFGQYRPLASNETKEGRRLNRRIEIIISPRQVGYF